MRLVLIGTVVLSLAVACSNPDSKNAEPNGDPNNVTVDSGNNVSVDGGDTDGGSGSLCGDSAGDQVTPCPVGAECEFRDDPREGCGAYATCNGSDWTLQINDCTPLPTATCPATREDAAGQACEPMDAYCDYDGLVCHCTNCIEGPVGMACEGEPTWMCAAPNPDSECPEAKPHLGVPCDNDGKACNYRCGPEGGRTCTDGTWQASDGGPCPISTVKVKRDIRYLTAAELAAVSAEVQAIPLAHWQYTDPSLGRGEKLGFIIEDLPSATPAVDRDRLMVDLYGYTSMLVADAQAREKQMQALEARLEQLERAASSCK
jgi:hypothetical protein